MGMSRYKAFWQGAALGVSAAAGAITMEVVWRNSDRCLEAPVVERHLESLQKRWEEAEQACPLVVPSGPLEQPGIEPPAEQEVVIPHRKHLVHSHAHTVEISPNGAPILE
jgi:hypothetical protein